MTPRVRREGAPAVDFVVGWVSERFFGWVEVGAVGGRGRGGNMMHKNDLVLMMLGNMVMYRKKRRHIGGGANCDKWCFCSI